MIVRARQVCHIARAFLVQSVCFRSSDPSSILLFPFSSIRHLHTWLFDTASVRQPGYQSMLLPSLSPATTVPCLDVTNSTTTLLVQLPIPLAGFTD